MPTYEYECQRCGHVFERFQSITEPPVKRCPKCRCKVKRLFGAGAGIIFKGSGFYETDYRRAPVRPGAKAPASETKPETKPESKPDAKPAAKPTETKKTSTAS